MCNIFDNQSIDFPDFRYIAGIDEAGRGPIAGPLVVAAVILKNDCFHNDLDDSKKLSEKKRNELFHWIIENSIDYSITIINTEEIDKLNILNATLSGMKNSYLNLKIKPDLCLIDGNRIPNNMPVTTKAIVKGDSKYSSISAASVLAKVSRDRIMTEIDLKYPDYEFKIHKGYPTKKHIELLQKYGATDIHRKSYKPVRDLNRLTLNNLLKNQED